MDIKIIHLKNCIAELLVFLIYVMFEQVIFVMLNGDRPGRLQLGMLFTIPLFYYLVRCKVHRFWLFMLLHILPPAVLIIGFREQAVYAVVFAIAALLQAFSSLNIRIKFVTDQEQFDYGYTALSPVGIVGMGLILYFISRADILIYPVLFYIVVYFLYIYLRHFLHYMDMNKIITGNIPEKSIFAINFSFVGGFTAVSALFMIFFSDIEFFSSALRSFMRWLGYLIRFLLSRGAVESPEVKDEEPLLPSADDMFTEASSTPFWAEVLEIIMTVIVVAFLLALAAVAIYLLIKLIRRVFGNGSSERGSDDEETRKDIVEKLKRSESGKATAGLSVLIKSPEEKIRKIFRKVLQKQGKTNPPPEEKGLLRYGTARECLVFLHADSDDAISLAYIYEKARYGDIPCTSSDVREAKRLARRLTDAGNNSFNPD